MTTTENLLRASLHARADRAEYEPTPLIQVAGRARALRRRRTGITLLAAAAAVAAVVVPVVVVLGSDREQTPQPAPAPTSAVTAGVASLASLPKGPAPGIAYVDDQTYVAADERRTDLPVGDGVRLSAVAPYRGGFLVTTANPAQPNAAAVSWLDSTGDIRWTRCGSDRLAVSEDGSVTGYATMDYPEDCERWIGAVLTWGLADEDRDLEEQVTSNGDRVDPVAITKRDMLYNVSDAKTGERIGVYVTPLMGPPEDVPGLQSAADLDPASGTLAATDRNGDGVLVDLDTGDVLVDFGSGRAPVAFSPDGRYVVTASFDADGSPPIAVHDTATGAEVLVVPEPEPDGTLPDPWAVAWEDDSHLLVGAMDTTQQAIVRIGLDGTVELATAPTSETLAGFLFPDGS